MKCENTVELVMDRLKGQISAADERLLSAHLATCAACQAETAMMTSVWEQLGALDEDVPHERLRARFHAGLAAHEARESRHWTERLLEGWWPRQPALQAAFAVALALTGVLIGQQLPSPVDAEVAALRDEVRTVGLALLDHQSASERLLGVEWSRRATQTPEVVNALLERVQYDNNLSVRLAAVDALRTELDQPGVRAGLAMALAAQESPLVQVAVTDALLATGSGTGIEAVRGMLERNELDPSVREYLQMALDEVGADSPPPNTDI
jgi:predicted anti-sigma-YlaC factor YlaD